MKTGASIGRRLSPPAAVPPLVYHGTPEDFERFEIFGLGLHFTVDRAVAEKFAGGRNGRVVAARLRIRRPLRLPDLATWGVNDVVINAHDRGGLNDEQAADLQAAIADASYDDRDLHAALAANGFDSLVYENRVEGGGDSYVVFDPRQIDVVAPTRIGTARGRPNVVPRPANPRRATRRPDPLPADASAGGGPTEVAAPLRASENPP